MPNQKLNQTVKLLALSLFLGATLSACRPPNPEVQDFSLEGEVQNNQQNNNQASERLQQMNEVQKTMADFKQIDSKNVTFETTKGEVVFELFTEKAPLTTTNFLNLVDEGFYDGIVFHRVEPGFVVQFGDPLTKQEGSEALWGTGGPGYTIADEFDPELRHNQAGILSMANRGPDTGGSQLFITLDETSFLDDKHAVLGRVTEGMDVVEQITVGDKILSATHQ